MNTTEVTGAQLASLLSEVDGLDQRIREKTQQLGILLGADLAYGELAPYIRRVISPTDGTKMRDTRTLRLEKIERLDDEVSELSRERSEKWLSTFSSSLKPDPYGGKHLQKVKTVRNPSPTCHQPLQFCGGFSF